MVKRILIVHNRYQQAGGEDRVVEAEADLLREHGHEVYLFADDNHRIKGMGKLETAMEAVWSRESYRKLAGVARRYRIEVCHFHNTFPLISPAAYYAARRAGAAVVQTLHNYRILCPGSLLMRDGRVCESCVGRRLVWPGAVHRCYRNSYLASAAAAATVSVHHLLGTWSKRVDCYIALGEFGRQKFIEGGLPAGKIEVKPNFVHPDPGRGEGTGGYALFVGRLSSEKGIATVLEAWGRHPEFPPLHIAGGGPLAALVEAAAGANSRVRWLGEISRAEAMEKMQDAQFLICPSTWYECFPLVVAEALACGLPVIASNLGALAELIHPEHTGLLFEAGCATDLAAKVRWALDRPDRILQMRGHARREYEARYSASHNYRLLSAIYEKAVKKEPAAAVRTCPAAA